MVSICSSPKTYNHTGDHPDEYNHVSVLGTLCQTEGINRPERPNCWRDF